MRKSFSLTAFLAVAFLFIICNPPDLFGSTDNKDTEVSILNTFQPTQDNAIVSAVDLSFEFTSLESIDRWVEETNTTYIFVASSKNHYTENLVAKEALIAKEKLLLIPPLIYRQDLTLIKANSTLALSQSHYTNNPWLLRYLSRVQSPQ